ncbi:SusC/RagA family TonB-linked outer membrane protein [Chitinophaga sp. SYP-B3965]|uniref:SusC/RagA family TonB-linked outer membrane protein n=1 Tax=Chitinophaga sp. SYP-B3965 TaxID=2663120 RepID=UPI0015668494|nr:SusC/RagA family TonB-linked outer membrane protein [Chitinophaga sp. SYP-B3965]
MKLTFLFLTVAFLSVHASGVSQTVSLAGKDLPLKKVFSTIEKQTGYVVFYNRELLENARPVTVDVNKMPLTTFLEITFKDQPLNYRITDKMITLFRKQETPSPFKIETLFMEFTGTVVNSATGAPVASASVKIKGAGTGTVTDAKGAFKIDLEPGGILVISSLGYETKEIKTNRNETSITIPLAEQASKLSETVVTAFGIEKSSKEIGYSVAKVSGEDINRANSGNLLTGLAGKVSGLNISIQSADMNPQMRVLLRGIRSFGATSNNQPLFIMNGTPLSFGSDQASASLVMDFINNINPADIQDVTVLKGANGTALYGPEGVNGVIIITTKKGQKGKPVFNYRNNVSFQRMDFRNDLSKQRSFGTGTGNVDANGKGIYSPVNNNGWGPAYDGTLVPIGRPDENGDYQQVTYSDKKDARRFFQVGQTIQNNLSLSQSDANSDFYMGLNHTTQKGMIPGDKQNAINLFFSGGRKMGKLNVQLNMNYTRNVYNTGPEFLSLLSTPTFIPLLSYKDYKNDKWSDNNHYWYDTDMMSPYQAAANNRSNSTGNAMVAGLVLTLKVLPWLTITEKPGIVYNGIIEKSTREPIYFSDFAKLYGGYQRYRDQLASLKEESRLATSLNNDLLVTALNKAGDFNFRTTFGASVRESFTKELMGSGNPIVPVFNLSFSRDIPYGSEKSLLSRFYSFFGTSGIGYKDRVFVELMARNDWDSKRASAGRGKDLYVGANTSVILNEVIPALGDLKWLSRLQLRAAVNGTANMNIEPYQSERTLELAYGTGFPYAGTTDDGILSYAFMAGNPNPYLKPEKILTQEYGASFNLWKDRVLLDVSYYSQRNNGVIMKVAIPWLSSGSTIDNLGVLRNYGWEMDLKFNPIFKSRSGLTLTADVRLAMNNNKVMSISEVYDGVFPLKKPMWGAMFGIMARTGQTAFEYQVYDWKRDPQGRVIVDKTTGMPDPDMAKEMYNGKTLPKYTGGLNINLSWKGFSLAVLGEFNTGAMHYFEQGGAQIQNGMHVMTTYNNREPFIIPNSVYEDGTPGKYTENTSVYVSNTNQQLYSHYLNASSLYLTKADFIKIREIVIGYERFFSSRILKKVNLSVYGRNLFNFYPKDNVYGDPQLIKGPGSRGYRTIPDNLTGSSSGVSTVAGVAQYGVITTFSF